MERNENWAVDAESEESQGAGLSCQLTAKFREYQRPSLQKLKSSYQRIP
jgi:hypothetical protein